MLRDTPPGNHVMLLDHAASCGLITEGGDEVTSLLLRCYCVGNTSHMDHMSCEVLLKSLKINNDVIQHVVLEQVRVLCGILFSIQEESLTNYNIVTAVLAIVGPK